MKKIGLFFVQLGLLCVAGMSLPLVATADGPIGGDIYGRINLSLDHVDSENDAAPLDEFGEWQLNSNASRIGLKGEVELNPRLSAIYQLEWQVNVDGDGSDLGARNRFLGLTGDFGTILGGKHDTPTKLAQNKIDLFNDLVGDIRSTFEGENRANDIVMYSSPEVGAFSASLAFIPGEEDGDQGAPDAATGDGLADGVSLAAHYGSEAIYFALAIDRDVDGQDLERLVGEFKFADFTLGTMLQHNENDAGTVDEKGVLVSGSYMLGSNVFKVQAGKLDNDATGGDEETLSLGYDRKLATGTRAFTYLTRNTDTDALGNDQVDTVFGAGLEHRF
ncbi:MAG: porin [Cellvibrionaceae bacterium]